MNQGDCGVVRMEIKQKEIDSKAVKFSAEKDGVEIGRAFIFLIGNDLHDKPYGLLEDVFVQEEFRGQGVGSQLLQAALAYAEENCYKLLATSRHSRPKVHQWYEKLGLKKYGFAFRMDFQ